jgi:agmatinase
MNLKFMNLPDEYSSKEKSKVYIIPVCYEGNMTNGFGTIDSYKAIVSASYELEYFDFDLKVEPYESGILVCNPIISKAKNHLVAIDEISCKLSNLNLKDKFPIFIGGDHSITSAM